MTGALTQIKVAILQGGNIFLLVAPTYTVAGVRS